MDDLSETDRAALCNEAERRLGVKKKEARFAFLGRQWIATYATFALRVEEVGTGVIVRRGL